MDPWNVENLTAGLAVLRREAETLARLGTSFPAVWRNAERILACVSMLEMDLGLTPENGDQGGGPPWTPNGC